MDDKFMSVYENTGEPSVVSETEGLVEAINVDDQHELIALSVTCDQSADER